MGCASSRSKSVALKSQNGDSGILSTHHENVGKKTHVHFATDEPSACSVDSAKKRSNKRLSHAGLPHSTRREIYSDHRPTSPASRLCIIHFNDVYNIEPREQEPVGGAARFVTKVKSFASENPLILFSGDCFNPSLMSTMTQGRQMIPVLNCANVHAACYGNHDFDFGVDHLIEMKRQTNFPWLISNVKDKLTRALLADGQETIVANWLGRKIGIIGLVEEEWLVTLATIDPNDVDYIDFVDCGIELARRLREEQGCDFIIALTHMRVPNDIRLLESDAAIDLILGGHDHHYETRKYRNKTFVKSGTDFREFSRIIVDFYAGNNNFNITTERVEVTKDVAEDETVVKETAKYAELVSMKMEEVLGSMKVELDGQFSTVRTKESNLGNFICDIMRTATQADVALLNSGSLRSDMIHPIGPFKKKDLLSILPMVDSLVVLEVPGSVLVSALENSVSQYPKYEGRFLQVSGISFEFDPEKPAGSRICRDSIMLHDNFPLQDSKMYSVVTKEYIAKGKDGYDMLSKCQKLIDEENGPVLATIIENHFTSIQVFKGRRRSVTGHRQSIVMRQEETQDFMEKQRSRLAPTVEGRIRKKGEITKQLSPTFIRRKSKIIVRSFPVPEQHTLDLVEEVADNSDDRDTSPIEAKTSALIVSEVVQQDDDDINDIIIPDMNLEEPSENEKLNLWESVRVDDIEKLKNIIGSRKLDFQFLIMDKTLLHHAAQHNSVQCLEYLLAQSNLRVDVRDETSRATPLCIAAEYGSVQACDVLLDNKAKVNAKDIMWNSALHRACENNKGDVIIVLLSRGADRTMRNKDGQMPRI